VTVDIFVVVLMVAGVLFWRFGWPLLVARHEHRTRVRELRALRLQAFDIDRNIQAIVGRTHAEMLRVLFDRGGGAGR